MKFYNFSDQWFKENRLVHLADGDSKPVNRGAAANNNQEAPLQAANNNVEEPEKKSRHDQKQEKIDSEKQRIKDLEKKVEKSNYTTETKQLAKNALQSGDEKEIALVEKLAQNKANFNQSDFRKKLKELRAKKKQNKENPASYVKSNVNDILLDKLSSQTPENEKKQKQFNEAVGQLKTLNKSEKELRGSIDQKLDKHIKANEITKEDAEKIGSLSPDSGLLRERIKELLGPKLSKEGPLLQYILDQKKKQKVIYDKFEKMWEVAESLLEEALKPVEIAKRKHHRMNFLKRLTGINLKEGLVMDYIGTSADNTPIRKRTLVEKIDFVTHELEFLNPDDVDEEYAKLLEKERGEMPNTLQITISFDGPNGEKVTRTLDEKKFLLWVNQNQAVEVIKTKKDLEKIIGFTDYDQELKQGMTLDYVAGKTNDANPLIKTVGVHSINEDSETIELTEPVQVLMHNEMHELDSVSSPRFKKKLTFGEFAKWFTRTRAEESMELDKCRDYLKKHPKVLQNRYKDIDKSIWDFNELPIEIKKGEELMIGNDKRIKIADVDDHEIKLDNGIKLTPGQFLRFVKEHEVEKASRVPSKDEIKKKVEDIVKEQDEKDSPDKSETSGESADSIGLLYGIWKGTQFLSLKDIYTLYKTTEEFLKRRHERNVKKRAGAFGQSLPGRWGAEFRNLAESAEHEEVNKYKEEMGDLDIWIIKGRLHETSDPDEAKAAFLLLTDKGLLNFDDKKVWKTMNRIMKKTLSISNYKKYFITEKGPNKNGEKGSDALKTAIDQVWGAPTGADWYSKNDGSYDSGVNSFTQDANDYENQYKGHNVASELHNMLMRHKNGDYVNPHRYESFIRFIIEAGKAEIEDKVYYLVAGITEKDPNGETILSKQRHAAIDGKYLNQLPLLDYFTRYQREGDENKFSVEYAEDLMKTWGMKSAPNQNAADQRYNKEAVRKFIWENMMSHDAVLRRLVKGTRKSENMDHDDAHLFIPMADEDLIYQSVVTNARGQQSNFTQEGLANGIAGYTHYLMSLANNAEKPAAIREKMTREGFRDPADLIKKTLGSFIAFESVVNKRNAYGEKYLRLGSNHLDNFPIVDGAKTTREHMDETKRVIHKILKAYHVSDHDINEYLYASYFGEKDKKKQSDHESFMKGFGTRLNKLVAEQGADKMIQIVIDSKNTGELNGFKGEDMTANKDEQEKRKEAAETAVDDDMDMAA